MSSEAISSLTSSLVNIVRKCQLLIEGCGRFEPGVNVEFFVDTVAVGLDEVDTLVGDAIDHLADLDPSEADTEEDILE